MRGGGRGAQPAGPKGRLGRSPVGLITGVAICLFSHLRGGFISLGAHGVGWHDSLKDSFEILMSSNVFKRSPRQKIKRKKNEIGRSRSLFEKNN